MAQWIVDAFKSIGIDLTRGNKRPTPSELSKSEKLKVVEIKDKEEKGERRELKTLNEISKQASQWVIDNRPNKIKEIQISQDLYDKLKYELIMKEQERLFTLTSFMHRDSTFQTRRTQIEDQIESIEHNGITHIATISGVVSLIVSDVERIKIISEEVCQEVE